MSRQVALRLDSGRGALEPVLLSSFAPVTPGLFGSLLSGLLDGLVLGTLILAFATFRVRALRHVLGVVGLLRKVDPGRVVAAVRVWTFDFSKGRPHVVPLAGLLVPSVPLGLVGVAHLVQLRPQVRVEAGFVEPLLLSFAAGARTPVDGLAVLVLSDNALSQRHGPRLRPSPRRWPESRSADMAPCRLRRVRC